jgi:peroxiredoxin
VSFDSPEANEAWAEDEGFSFELWTDESRELAMTYGAASSSSTLYASRVTRVLDAEGVLVLEYAVTTISAHPAQVLDDCKLLWPE